MKLFGKELNNEELVVGAIISVPFLSLLAWATVPLAVVTGVLWGLGGAERSSKLWRRLGVPVAITGMLVATHTYYWPFIISALLGHLVLRIGYGIPDPDMYAGRDNGSVLGRWVCQVFRCDYNTVSGQNRASLIVHTIQHCLFWLSYGILWPMVLIWR